MTGPYNVASSSVPLLRPDIQIKSRVGHVNVRTVLLSVATVVSVCLVVATMFAVTSTQTSSPQEESLHNLRSSVSDSDPNSAHQHLQGSQGMLHIKYPTTLCDSSVKQISGYFTVNANQQKRYFFWFFEARNSTSTSPTTLWMSGGPGASSMLALLAENGPCSIDENGRSQVNPYSWTEASNMLWVDQPAGTGYSMGEFDHSELEVSEDMYVFVQTFFEHFPQYNTRFVVSGESYGGHYVPAVTYKIASENKYLQLMRPSQTMSGGFNGVIGTKGRVLVNLYGMAIGNGMTNTLEQSRWYPDMAFNSSTAPSIVSEKVYLEMKAALPEIEKEIEECAMTDDKTTCMNAWQLYSSKLMEPVMSTGVNVYDLRAKGAYDFSPIQKYLNQPDVKEELGALKPWTSVNVSVWFRLAPNDFLRSYQQLVPPLLHEGIKVLVYAGDQDYMCNWLGNNAWTEQLRWLHKEEFSQLVPQVWIGAQGQGSANQVGGFIRRHSDFMFMRVKDAGHMVPKDQPEHSLEMLRQFLDDTLGRDLPDRS